MFFNNKKNFFLLQKQYFICAKKLVLLLRQKSFHFVWKTIFFSPWKRFLYDYATYTWENIFSLVCLASLVYLYSTRVLLEFLNYKKYIEARTAFIVEWRDTRDANPTSGRKFSHAYYVHCTAVEKSLSGEKICFWEGKKIGLPQKNNNFFGANGISFL